MWCSTTRSSSTVGGSTLLRDPAAAALALKSVRSMLSSESLKKCATMSSMLHLSPVISSAARCSTNLSSFTRAWNALLCSTWGPSTFTSAFSSGEA